MKQTDDNNLTEQVAQIKADMSRQYQNLLNEFTIEQGQEVAKLKAGKNFSYLFLFCLFDGRIYNKENSKNES